MLRLAASLEQGSEHPLASAIVRAARARNLAIVPGATFESVTGRGVAGRVGDREVVVGNADLLRERGVAVGEDMDAVVQRTQGRTLVHVAVDGKAVGRLAVADPIKPGVREALAALAADGLRIVMLTGDARDTAVAVAAELGIAPADVIAGVLPASKREVIRDLQAHGAVVAMAGDGVNDAPALAEAAVGIAMGTGTDVAMESAGITLVSGDVRALVRARRLSRDTMRNIRQNLFLAFAYNAIGVPVAAGVLYPLVGLLVSPIWASAAMTFSSVSVIGNALRLRRG
jgi:Cu+-exporting ATPase